MDKLLDLAIFITKVFVSGFMVVGVVGPLIEKVRDAIFYLMVGQDNIAEKRREKVQQNLMSDMAKLGEKISESFLQRAEQTMQELRKMQASISGQKVQ